ncbi:hypothetical protein BZA77DRAFT_342112 [Pyronema omphalodes]|nr:hypothetical protein BZA77DRAFT_342112 [Pyronema omphalodes]
MPAWHAEPQKSPAATATISLVSTVAASVYGESVAWNSDAATDTAYHSASRRIIAQTVQLHRDGTVTSPHITSHHIAAGTVWTAQLHQAISDRLPRCLLELHELY